MIESDLVAKVGIRERWFGCVGSAAITVSAGPGSLRHLSRATVTDSDSSCQVELEAVTDSDS